MKKSALVFLVSLVFLVLPNRTVWAGNTVPILSISDSINPGTSDYIISNIRAAESDRAPFLVIELDTPGGLLTATRQIVQKMLNSSIPIVVFVGPKGAHAGSAGALITFAADVAAMAPGTNMGAAHPVVPGGGKLDDTMNEKITNDTAAFAESIAKARGRNQSFAAKAVRQSESVIADVALREGVIDLIAENRDDLLTKLPGFRLKVAKNEIKALPAGSVLAKEVPLSLKQRLVSFFADPNLAYMILSLGGLCIWVELSHPGMIFPGVLGVICVLLSLISFQMMPIHYGALAFMLLGMVMIIAEVFLPTFGLLGVGGIIAFVVGSIYLMDTSVPEFQIATHLILSMAGLLSAIAFGLGFLVLRARKTKLQSGMDALIGQFAEVKETISATGGRVYFGGEFWTATSLVEGGIPAGSQVRITGFSGLILQVTKVG